MQDLRIEDNPALFNAANSGIVFPVYIVDDINSGQNFMGSASRVWLNYALVSLNKSLNNNLALYMGDSKKILKKITEKYGISEVYFNRLYEPWQVELQRYVSKMLNDSGIVVKSYNASLLWEPSDILKSDNTAYKLFTPYYKKGCLGSGRTREVMPRPKEIKFLDIEHKFKIEDMGLLPKHPWHKKIIDAWDISEEGAHNKFLRFLNNGINGYRIYRNFPAKNNISGLSAYLHFGQISPNYIWHVVRSNDVLAPKDDVEHFCSELGWREFSYYLLHHYPNLPNENLNVKFDHFPWEINIDNLHRWKKGSTGIPIVDAGMRQLWDTGYMHNRVRMIVASFLVKNLLIHWKEGERWFWDCLIDADLANNNASWQWVAGCGADAAPYFRIFNPVLQSKKFDPKGTYIKKYVPELNKLDNKYLFSPWDASEDILLAAGITLDKDYPRPIVDLSSSRNYALSAFAKINTVKKPK